MLQLIVSGCGGAPEPRADSGTSAAAPASCGIDGVPRFTGAGVGSLRVGATVASVRAACTVLRDTAVLDMEGMPARELTVAIPGAHPVTGEVVGDSIWRIRLESSPPVGPSGVGVGSFLPALRLLGEPTVLMGEGKAFVTVPGACGVSFGLDDAPLERMARARTQAAMRAALPDSARVDTVLLTGC